MVRKKGQTHRSAERQDPKNVAKVKKALEKRLFLAEPVQLTVNTMYV
jgi:hypothetical protein